MAHYGQVLHGYEPQRDALYGYFDTYFNHPEMTKIKSSNGLSTYMVKNYCLLSQECRYIVAQVPEDHLPLQTTTDLGKLPWVSLQTRTLKEPHQLPSHEYQPRAQGPLNASIRRKDYTKEASTYVCDSLPIVVTLLHRADGNHLDYQDEGRVVTALETYQTIITLATNT